MITFTKVKLPYGWLGNMSHFPVTHGIVFLSTTQQDKEYRTAEALFQAMRFDDEEIIEAIRANKSPMGAKMEAKKHKDKMTVKPTSKTDVKNMFLVLQLKIKQHPELKDKLLGTHPEQIIEDCTKRDRASARFWGAVLVGDTWEGKNVLGRLWMLLRDKIMNDNRLHSLCGD